SAWCAWGRSASWSRQSVDAEHGVRLVVVGVAAEEAGEDGPAAPGRLVGQGGGGGLGVTAVDGEDGVAVVEEEQPQLGGDEAVSESGRLVVELFHMPPACGGSAAENLMSPKVGTVWGPNQGPSGPKRGTFGVIRYIMAPNAG